MVSCKACGPLLEDPSEGSRSRGLTCVQFQIQCFKQGCKRVYAGFNAPVVALKVLKKNSRLLPILLFGFGMWFSSSKWPDAFNEEQGNPDQ